MKKFIIKPFFQIVDPKFYFIFWEKSLQNQKWWFKIKKHEMYFIYFSQAKTTSVYSWKGYINFNFVEYLYIFLTNYSQSIIILNTEISLKFGFCFKVNYTHNKYIFAKK